MVVQQPNHVKIYQVVDDSVDPQECARRIREAVPTVTSISYEEAGVPAMQRRMLVVSAIVAVGAVSFSLLALVTKLDYRSLATVMLVFLNILGLLSLRNAVASIAAGKPL